MSENWRKIETYKGVDLYYDISDGKIYFDFEGGRVVKYVFEAKGIIDEPVYEKCDEKGFYKDHILDEYIGLAKAERRNIKTGRPDWKYKGRYDINYKKPNTWCDRTKVYPVTKHNLSVYKRWKEKRGEYLKMGNEVKCIIAELKED